MPTYDEIIAFSSAVLTDAETNYVRRILRRGSTVSPPLDADVTVAVAALTAEQRQEVRALIESYGQYDLAGEVVLDGGADALKYDAVRERWGVRNDLRVLLDFAPEPAPMSSDTLTQVLIELPTITMGETEA